MGNCQLDYCKSRKSDQNDGFIKTLSVCHSIMKQKIKDFPSNRLSKPFIFLESAYIVITNLLNGLLQTPKGSPSFPEKVREPISSLSVFLITNRSRETMEPGKQDPLLTPKGELTLKKLISALGDLYKREDIMDSDSLDLDKISNDLEKKVDEIRLSDDLLLISGDSLWEKLFGEYTEIEWEIFKEPIKEDLERMMKEDFSAGIQLSLKSHLDINNNLKADRFGWNLFYFEVLSDPLALRTFIKSSQRGCVFLKNSIFLNYLAAQKPKEFSFELGTSLEISDEGLLYPKKIRRNLNEKPLIFGRQNTEEDVDIVFNSNSNGIAKRQFSISAKYVLDEKTASIFKTEFYITNLSLKTPIIFPIESKPYLLTQNSWLVLKPDIKILIKTLYPHPQKIDKDKYMFLDLGKKPLLKRGSVISQNPAITFQVISGNEKVEKKFEVFNQSSNFQISIGNSYANDFTIPKAENNHCSIHYSAMDGVWFVVDLDNGDILRTFLFPPEKGVRLKDGMKINVRGHIFEVRDLS